MIERVFTLKRADVFRDLPSSILESLAAHLHEVHLEPGETLFEKGDLGHAMYVVAEGRLRVHDGEATLAALERGSVLGEVSVLTSEERMASVTAETPSRLLRLEQEVLYEVMAVSPEISRGLIAVLLRRLGESPFASGAAGAR